MIDDEDQLEDRFVVIIQSATRSYKKNREGNIAENKDNQFKQEKGSMNQDERCKMDGWEMFPLRNMHG